MLNVYAAISGMGTMLIIFQLHHKSGKYKPLDFVSLRPRISGEPLATMWLNVIATKENEYALTKLRDTKNPKNSVEKLETKPRGGGGTAIYRPYRYVPL